MTKKFHLFTTVQRYLLCGYLKNVVKGSVEIYENQIYKNKRRSHSGEDFIS